MVISNFFCGFNQNASRMVGDDPWDYIYFLYLDRKNVYIHITWGVGTLLKFCCKGIKSIIKLVAYGLGNPSLLIPRHDTTGFLRSGDIWTKFLFVKVMDHSEEGWSYFQTMKLQDWSHFMDNSFCWSFSTRFTSLNSLITSHLRVGVFFLPSSLCQNRSWACLCTWQYVHAYVNLHTFSASNGINKSKWVVIEICHICENIFGF